MRNRSYLISIFVYCTIIHFHAIMAFSSELDNPSIISHTDDGFIRLKAKNIPLQTILDDIEKISNLRILGLKHMATNPITVQIQGKTIQHIIKRLFRYLDIDNYAFEFSDNDLTFVRVFPKGTSQAYVPPIQSDMPPPPFSQHPTLISTVKVISVLPDTQAQSIGLLPGDYIIQYDGVLVHTAQQLVKEVKEKHDKSNVDIMIVRRNNPFRYGLKGGIIGVRIVTANVNEEDIGKYYK